MPKKNCLDCIAYCNMLPDGKCGLGFEIEEVMEISAGFSIAVHPVDGGIERKVNFDFFLHSKID